MQPIRLVFALTLYAFTIFLGDAAATAPRIHFVNYEAALDIHIDDVLITTYVWDEPRIPRPYFANIHAPGGIQVTRNHPVEAVADAGNDDHAEYHPGIWLAFGDINGEDFWRLKARMRHIEFSQLPVARDGSASFEVRNAYESLEGMRVAEERCRYTIHATENSYILESHSIFSAIEKPVVFGDQEEMGFGVRLATPLTVRHGNGQIKNSDGGINESGTWGKRAAWCAGYGSVEGRTAGVLIAPDAGNFRPSWFHSRDYGLIVANPFGQKAMTAPNDDDVPPDSTVIAPGESMQIAFRAAFFSVDTADPDLNSIYAALAALPSAAVIAEEE